jgi:hypothetical protein
MPPGQTVCIRLGERGLEVVFEQKAFHENHAWPGYSRIVPQRAWDYAVKVECEDDRPDPQESARDVWAALDRIAATLSLGLSAPVIVLDHKSATDAPAEPVAGEVYTTLSYTRETAAEVATPEVDHTTLLDQACLNGFVNKGMERVHRSMRWLQHSHYAQTPVEEFICIMIGLEAISGVLGEPVTHRWSCAACGTETPNCPNCGAPTDWRASGEGILRRFVCDQLDWPLAEWKSAWNLRNVVVHGRRDISGSELGELLQTLPRVEHALVCALGSILKLPAEAAPRRLRDRNPYEAVLHVKWRAPGETPSEGKDTPPT